MEKKDLNGGRVNSIMGTALGFGLISAGQVPYALLILVLCLPFMLSNPAKGLLLFVSLYGLFWFAAGNEPSAFFERWLKPNRYISEETTADFDRSGVPIADSEKRKQASRFKIKGKDVTFKHVEQKFKLRTYGQIEIDTQKIGFYLLQRGPKLMIIFAWIVEGHDPSMTEEQAYSIVGGTSDALNQLPKDIDLKFYQDINSSSSAYVRQQIDLQNECGDILNRKIIKSRIQRAKELEQQGRLQNNNILVLAKYRLPLGEDYAVKQNWLDDFLSQTQPLVGMIRGQKFDTPQAWSKVLDSAYNHAYQAVNTLLKSNRGFGLQAKSLNVFQLWVRDYLELHNPPVIPIPQYIVYNEKGLQPPVINSHMHPLGAYFEPVKGLNVVPRFDRKHIYFPSKNKFSAFIRIGQVKKFPPYKNEEAMGYMRYLWNIVAGDSTVTDCRIITEITADRSGFENIQLDRIISNSVKREAIAAKKQTVDVVAMKRTEKAIKARDQLEDSNIPCWVSVGIWIYRSTRNQLEYDAKRICGSIPSASVERIENTTEDTWFQSHAFEWESFLTKPNHKRQKYYSYQSVPLIPMIKTKKLNRKGMMFLTRELSTPVFLDIANEKNHTGIFAKTGAGKSNIILEMLLEYSISEQFVVLFDFPRPDGTSTYTTLIPILQQLGVRAAYYNVRETVTNIIELPDLREITNEEDYEIRWKDSIASHVRLLCALVMGTLNNPEREVLVTSLLTECYSDFHDQEDIKQRYAEAIAGGFGSPEAKKMPIYENFVHYAQEWFARYVEGGGNTYSELTKETIDIILIQLRGVLRTPLGRSINGISSYNTDVDILVIGLTNVAENLESLMYAMTGLNALYRGAFSSKRSLLGIDEGTILYKFHLFARETGIIPVHGRKWGCNFLVAAQETKSIHESVSGTEIFDNLDNIFCGRIESTAIDTMENLNFRPSILQPYTTDAFKPSKELLQSLTFPVKSEMQANKTF